MLKNDKFYNFFHPHYHYSKMAFYEDNVRVSLQGEIPGEVLSMLKKHNSWTRITCKASSL